MDKDKIRERVRNGPKGGYGQLYKAMGKENPHEQKKETSTVVPFVQPQPMKPLTIDPTEIIDIQQVVTALPHDMAIAVQSTADTFGYPLETCVVCAISVANAACQSLYDVDSEIYGITPVSLYQAIISKSSDFKSSTLGKFTVGIKNAEVSIRHHYEQELQKYEQDIAANRKAKLPVSADPEAPPFWDTILDADNTFNGLLGYFENARSAGLLASEGAIFLNSWDNRNEQTATIFAQGLCKFWSGEAYKKMTGPKRIRLRGRRFSMLLMIQPDLAGTLVSNPSYDVGGLSSRLLVVQAGRGDARQPTEIEQRTYKINMDKFWKRTEQCLIASSKLTHPNISQFSTYELHPTVLNWSPGAKAVSSLVADYYLAIRKHFIETNHSPKHGQHIETKGHENTIKVAGTFAAFEGRNTIEERDMMAAELYIRYCIQERNRIGDVENFSVEKDTVRAERAIIKWIGEKSEGRFLSYITSDNAPAPFKKLDSEVKLRILRSLVESGQLVKNGKTFTVGT